MNYLSTLWPLLQPIVAGQIRHVLTVVAGYLVAKGAIQSSETTEFVSIGLGIGLWCVSASWSLWQQYGQEKMLAVMAKMHPVVPPHATMAEAVKVATEIATTTKI